MAKKRLIRKAVKQELSSSSKSFVTFMKPKIKEIGEEIGCLPRKFKTKNDEGEKGQTHPSFLGFIWPVISALLGILLLLVIIFLLNKLNTALDNYFVAALAAFFYNNLYLFFALSLFFGYADYLKARFPQVYWIISPVIDSMSVVAVVWIFSMALTLVSPTTVNNTLMNIANVIYLNLDRIFIIFLVFGYFLLFSKIIIRKTLKSYK